jgi:hypothetical protein
LEWVLVIPVACLAFFLASFPARNSEIWIHLARGRLLAQEGFSTATAINLYWLYDLLIFGVYSAAGGTGLVVGKAFVVVGLALVMLRLSRFGQGWWLPAFCTALALLAMSTRLLVQPATISCLFLALALWALREHPDNPGIRLPSLLAPVSLLALFLLWANIDVWFILGMAIVTLIWLGRILDDALWKAETKDRLLSSLMFLVSSLISLAAVCLLNPTFLLHSSSYFQVLFGELGWFGFSSSHASSLGMEHVTSPFQGAYFARLGWVPAGLAYFPLLGLSLLSFVLNYPRWHWQRFLPWLALALLSAVQVRTVPFFAVVAGPVLAWNIQEFLAFQLSLKQRQHLVLRRSVALACVLAVEAILILPICAWPGWLQLPPYEPRRWTVETPASIESSAAATKRWLGEGKLAATARGLHISPDTNYAFAWLCPEANGLRDDALSQAIFEESVPREEWRARLRSEGVHFLVLYDTDRGRLNSGLERLLIDSEEWPLLFMEGYVAVFGWRDPEAVESANAFRDWQVDVDALAFRPAEGKRAPRSAPDREPEVRQWWEAFWKPVPPRPIDQEEATLRLFHAEALRRYAPQRRIEAWEPGQSAALVAASAGWEGPGALFDARMRLALVRPQLPKSAAGYYALPGPDQIALSLQQQFTLRGDDAPPALLYLAIRAARRAVAANPDDAQAYLVLGECYLRLLHATRERAWGDNQLPENLPKLVQLRRVQASAALNQAVSLKPGFAQAHLNLYHLYAEMSGTEVGFLDLALQHLRAYVKVLREDGPPPGMTADQFHDQQVQIEDELSQLVKEVEKRDNLFEVASAGWKVGDRAMKALQMGLAGKARDLLLESDIAAFGPKGMGMELELLLRSGRPKDVWHWTGELSPENKALLGESYYWMRIQALAASGDYALAQQECNDMARAIAAGPDPVRVREIMALLVGRRVFVEQASGGTLPELLLLTHDRFEFRVRLDGLAQSLRRDAEITVLRGLLALEEGDTEEAEIAFRTALSYWKDADTANSGAGLDFRGRAVAQGYLELLK